LSPAHASEKPPTLARPKLKSIGREVANYLVAGCKPWNQPVLEEVLRMLPGRWMYVNSATMLGLVRSLRLEDSTP